MNVRELIKVLEQENPEAEVVVRNISTSSQGTYRKLAADRFVFLNAVLWNRLGEEQIMGPEYAVSDPDAPTRPVVIMD